MKLYHATSEFAWEKIQQDGFLGVTEEILLSYIQGIFEQLNVPECKRKIFYKKASIELEEYAPNGMVSFFPEGTTHMEYSSLLGKILGEGFGHDMKRAVKYASRVTKTNYKNNLAKISFLVQTHVPVMLTVDIPISLLANPDVIGTKNEHYTTGVVPIKYIVEMKYIEKNA